METVIAGVEDSRESRDVLRFARQFSDAEGAALHVVSVFADTIFVASLEEIEISNVTALGESVEALKTARLDESAAASPRAGMIGASRAFLSSLEKLGRAARQPRRWQSIRPIANGPDRARLASRSHDCRRR